MKDPHSSGTLDDIRAQVSRALEIRDNLNTVIDDINQIEWIRKQLLDYIQVLKQSGKNAEVMEAAKRLETKFSDVEGHFFQKILAEGDLKSFRAPNKLYSQLAILAGDIANGSADFPPTDQQIAVHEELKKELETAQASLDALLAKDMQEFETLLQEHRLPAIVTEIH